MLPIFLFDLDGTLIDSERLGVSTFYLTCKHFNINPSENFSNRFDHMWRLDSSLTAFENFLRLHLSELTHKISTDDFISRYYKIYAEEVRSCPELHGAKELLSVLRYKTKIGLVTGSNREQVEAVAGQIGGLDQFTVIVTHDDVDYDKPSPEPYLKALSLLNVTSQECIVVENSLVGITSANYAGIRVLAVTDGNPEPQDYSLASRIFRTPKEILYYLNENNFLIV